MTSRPSVNRPTLLPPGMPWSKRLLDLLLVLITAPLWAILILMVGLFVAARLGRPLLFSQARQGFQGTSFRFLKFRTMSEDRDAAGALLPDEERLGRTGALLRATSLDELPQIWLVLIGRMSLVGPRPLPVLYADRYSETQRRRFEVYPGITGLAQVRGRNRIDWESRFQHDLEYVQNRTLWLDLKILFLTVWQILFRIHSRGREDTLSKPFDPER